MINLSIKEINGCTLWHHSKNIITKFDNRKYQQYITTKPSGIWFSFKCSNGEDTWENYCKIHNFMVHNLANKVQIELNIPITETLLYVTSPYDVFKLEEEYGERINLSLPSIIHIDWEKVSQDYCGIVLYEENPKCLRSLGFGKEYLNKINNWLDTWSVYSGCIWNANYVNII